MDYKYIEQLLERYWQCETTLQEEAILRAFFSQEEVPVSLLQYKALFTYELQKEYPLGSDFDARILSMTEEKDTKKADVPLQTAKTFTLTSRLKPLFKAAAIVAIILTLGNAAQAPWNYGWEDPKDAYAKFHQQDVDSISTLGTIQAENMTDSVKVTTDTPTYIE